MSAKPNQTPERKSPRLPGYDYSQLGGYFVTIVSSQRVCIFGDIVGGEIKLSAIGLIIQDEWLKTQKVRPNVVIDEYVIMPNHLHGIIFIEDVGATRRVAPTRGHSPIISGSLGAIIGQIKSISTKRINSYRGTPGSPVWQRNYYEHIIRDENDLMSIRQYILNNPLQWDLDHENPRSTR